MRALILGNGERISHGLLAHLREQADLFIATDGAAATLLHPDILPDIILGDFDSLDAASRGRIPADRLFYAPDQEASDLEKAIEYALGRGATCLTLTGVTGGRPDHTLVAFSLLLKYHGRLDIRIVEEKAEIRAVTGSAEWHGRPGDTLSLIAFEAVEGVSLEGVRWPLCDETLTPGSRGVSNVLTADTARLRVRSGVLLACHLRRGGEGVE